MLLSTRLLLSDVALLFSAIAGMALMLSVALMGHENNTDPAWLLANRTGADTFNYTRIKQTVVSLRVLQQQDPDFWSPYLQAVYDNARPDKKYCHLGNTAPATSLLMFLQIIVFHGEDLSAVMYFAGVHNDARDIPEEIRDLFVAMRRNACAEE